MTRPFPESLLGFQRMFPTETACAAYLEALRWPERFTCSGCGVQDDPYCLTTRPTVRKCRSCHRETSLTAGTVLHRSRVPLQKWFWAAYLVTSKTPGISAVQLQRQLGIERYETAFDLLHKLRTAMVRPDRDRIGRDRVVELDETLVGGKTRGKGRGIHTKAVVVGAVEVRRGVSREGQRRAGKKGIGLYAGRLRLRHIADRGAPHLERFVRDSVEPGTIVLTDDWQGYAGLKKLGYDREFVPMKGDRELLDTALPLIHLVFSNLKTWLQGTHHGVSDQYLQAYLNEYVFRFNRRFYPMTMFNSVLGIAARMAAPANHALNMGHSAHPKG